jgi:hypothetical protein
MKADLISLDAARVERGRYTAPPGAGPAVRAVLISAGLALTAGGIVASALWFVWKLAEIVP